MTIEMVIQQYGMTAALDLLADTCMEKSERKPRGRKAKAASKRWRKMATILDKASRKLAKIE